MLAICMTILVLAALRSAAGIMAPVACALFATALAWPMQRRLEAWLPRLLALLLTMLVAVVVVGGLASMVVWGTTRLGGWMIGNAARFQAIYEAKAAWLAGHDIYLGSLIVSHFNMGWLIRLFQAAGVQLQGFVTFAAVVFIFLMLGLLEVDASRASLAAISERPAARIVLQAGAETAAKLRRYMLVRTLMSLFTGLAVFGFARLIGLDLAVEWGVIAFAMNYIPVIGPLAATVLPTILAAAQFESVGPAVTVFAGLNTIQFVIGSYLEPRIAGARLALSPVMVLFAVFAGSFLWGVVGAFIGVPALIAAVTLCAQSPASAWAARLLSGTPRRGA